MFVRCVHLSSQLRVCFSFSLRIINDKLFVQDPSHQGNESTFCIPLATLSSTSVPALSQEQQEMVQAFSVRSGMNCKWSQK